MKQTLFMLVLTAAGIAGAFAFTPYWGVAVYYLYAVLRPQAIWDWALPGDYRWSFWIAAATIVATIKFRLGIMQPLFPTDDEPPERTFRFAHKAVLFFGIWVSITCLTAHSPEVSEPYLYDYLKIFTMFVVAALWIWSVRKVWLLYVMAAVVLGYLAYEVNYLYLVNGNLRIFHSGYGGLDNNGAALMLAMGVPLCFFAWDSIEKWYRWGFILFIPLILHAVLMSYSRGAMLSLLVTLPLYFVRARRKLQLLAISVLIGLLVPVLAGNEIRNRFFSIQQHEVDESAQSRWTTWRIGWEIATENPVFGIGVRNSNLFTFIKGADIHGRTIHSQYIQIAADSGLVGLGLYLLAMGAGWMSLRRVRRATKYRTDPEGRRAYGIACGVESSLAVFCFGGLFLSLETFELPYFLLLLGAQLPLALRLPDQAQEPAEAASKDSLHPTTVAAAPPTRHRV